MVPCFEGGAFRMSGGLKLDNIIFTGRTYDEYVRMFNLSADDVAHRTFFVCPGGASSFSAVATRHGGRVVAGDIVYGESRTDLERRGRSSLEIIESGMRDVGDGYHWGELGDVNGLLRTRAQALDTFLADYETGLSEGRYIPCALPSISLEPDAVDMVLSDHLLFTYPQFFDEAFHVRSIEAMVRIAKREVRLFPLISSASGARPPSVEAVVQHVRRMGWEAVIETVPYHFQNGANEMLRISKPA
jgi:hypothetical protein